MAKLIIGKNDLESFCKKTGRLELLDEWDLEKNTISPNKICYGSARKFWWIGKCGHSWQASLNRRTSSKTGCPYCCDSHAKLLKGFNDLETTNPELLSSWDYDKNEDLLPSMVMKGQHRKVWWKGPCGHSWQATIYHRVQGRGCPICKKESKTSFQEQAIFYYIKKIYPDTENGNTTILNGKELDIYIPSIKTAIEFDGSSWHKDTSKDEKKNTLCKKKGIILYRIREINCPSLPYCPNVHIISFNDYSDLELHIILTKLLKKLNIFTDIDIDIERDRIDILNQYIATQKDNSLLESYPKLAKEWNYEKNGDLTPDLVSAMSSKKIWWKGKCGHEWQARIHSRAKDHGCPFCNGNRLLKGYNDLETLNPEILTYWSYEKNAIQPCDLTSTSSQKVWWHCQKCGNDSMCGVRYKIKFPNSCPYCAGKKVKKGYNDLQTVDPTLAKEWDYKKNTELSPDSITIGYDTKIWWKCAKGHSYKATISNRRQGRGCPFCSNHKVLSGYNDILTVAPFLKSEWNYKKNGDILPSNVLAGGKKSYWWICSKGHEWKTSAYSRINGHGCPYCCSVAKRTVKNLDTGEIYKTLSDAAKSCGLKVGDTISLCCQGKQKTAGGYHWAYTEFSE